ncbi:MAG: hypothetical protein M3Q71_10820 [Chloroflexota bacterium]|nr:hypothetical protein [Chloroflexota bacterium]
MATQERPADATPPTTLPIRPDRIPDELAQRPQWVCWRWERTNRPSKPWTKVPINPTTGNKASSTNPATWSTLAAALEGKRRLSGIAGVGYVFAADDPYVGIDQDGCRDPQTGHITPEAMALAGRLDSYTEASVSGTGLHTILRATLPAGGNRKGAIEVYAAGRFFTFTGCTLPGLDTITDRADELVRWHRELFPPPSAAPIPVSIFPPLRLDDRDLLERCRRSPKFCRLHDTGDLSDYEENHSRADLGLLDFFVREGATDPDQLERLFDGSALGQRDKWRARTDYRERTIARALDGRVVPFPPGSAARPLAATGTEDATGTNATDLPDDLPTLKAMIVDLGRRVEAAEQRAARAEERAARLGELQSKTVRIMGNNHLRTARTTAAVLSYEFANREAADDPGDNGLYPIPLKRIAERSGCSEDAAASHIELLASNGAIRKETRWIPEQIDPETGEITGGHKRQFLGPVGGTITFAETVATLTPAKPSNWGGKRTACPDHPEAGAIKRWTLHCAECDRELDAGEEYQAPRATPQDAEMDGPTSGEESPRRGARGARGTPRIAASKNGNHGGGENRKLRSSSLAPDPRSPTASAWLAGSAVPSAAHVVPVDDGKEELLL